MKQPFVVEGLADYDLQLDYTFSRAEVEEALAVRPEDVRSPQTLTYCKNVFLPLTTACKYTCAYCTYYDVPGQETLMSESDVQSALARGAQAGCSEALFTFGDQPDARYAHLRARLKRWGYASLHDYHVRTCEWALAAGLLPHSNPGDLDYEPMAQLKEVNASMGMMLETTAAVAAHAGRRHKTPGRRLQTLEYAGRLRVPFTTGLLVGIGETWTDRALSLLSLKRLHEAYGHLQEVIVQNVVPNHRWRQASPDVLTMRRVLAMARAVLPPEVEVQLPPNLSPVAELLDCGVGDLGGVSPVTEDFINPDYRWPTLEKLETLADHSSRTLVERLSVYPQYIDRAGWLGGRVRAQLSQEHYQKFLHPHAQQSTTIGGVAHG